MYCKLKINRYEKGRLIFISKQRGSQHTFIRKKAIYVRVSTDSQVEGYSIETQIELVTAYLKSKEWSNYVIYMDPGFSGKNLDRPKMQELISDIKDGKIDCVLVFKLDRISRSQKDTLYLIEEVFNKYNCGFISIRENFDTTTPFGKAMIGILSVFAQLERETILERTKLGLKKRAEDGLWRGGGKIPFAYDYDKEKGELIVNKERKKIFDRMKSLRLQGYSYPQIEKLMGIDESMIQKILLNKTNLGFIPYKEELFQGKHEAILTKKEYEQLLEVEKNRSKGKGAKHYLLSGKIYCGKCGAKYRYQKWGKRMICYCYSRQKSKPKLIKDPNCNNKKWDSFQIEDGVLENLFAMKISDTLLKSTFPLSEVNQEEEIRFRIDKINKQLDNLISFIADGILEVEIKEKIEKLTKEKKQAEEFLLKIKKRQKQQTGFRNVNSLGTIWKCMTFEEQRTIIEHLVEKVIIEDNTLSIKWRISVS